MKVINQTETTKLVPLQAALKKTAQITNHLAVFMREKIELVDVSDIVYLKSEGSYTRIHLSNGNTLLACQTLKHFQQGLGILRFLKIHRSYIVQKAYIKTYYYEDQSLLLCDGNRVPVSIKQKPLLIQFLSNCKCGS